VFRSAALILAVALLAAPLAAQTREDRAEVEAGRRAGQQIERSLRVVTDPATNERVGRIGAAVAAVTQRPQLPWTFKVVEHRTPNAVALPGGLVYVTSAMVNLVRTDHELAALLAHEAAHVALRHHQRMEREATRTNLLVFLVAVLARDARVAAGAQLVGGGVLSAFGRDLEREADVAAVGYLVQTPWHPVGMLTLLERLAREDTLTGGADPGAFRTHPAWEDRVRAVEAELARLGVPLHRRVSAGFLRLSVDEEGPVGVVRVNDKPVLRLSGGRARAAEVADRLDRVFNEDPSPLDVRAVGVLGEWSVRVADHVVLVVSPQDVRLFGRDARDLAQELAQRLREAIAEDRRLRALHG
jgi:Zn-dependent protease with chaperone function